MKILKSKIPPNYPFNTKILLSNNIDELIILCKRIVDEFPGTQSEMLALLELAKISAINNDTTKSIEYLGKINSNKRATKPLLLFSGLILENLGKYIEALAIYYEIIIKSDSPIWLKTSQDRINQILHSDGFRKKYPFWRRFIIHLRYMFKIRRLLSKK
ncbi:hypothetical protein KAX75_00355 [candidate division WOR-3 bacterium]|nr:hypothetical protein [candidate division WOR-3 bacterium]